MSRERTLNVAKAVTAQIHATEEAIDTALSEAANLIETYVSSRRAIRMSAMISNEVHENTLKAMMALNTAQQYMTAAHKSLSRIQTQLRIEASAIIPPYEKLDDDKKDPPRDGGISNTVPGQRPAAVAF